MGSKPRYTTPIARTIYQIIQRTPSRYLKPGCLGLQFISSLPSPTTRWNLDGWKQRTNWEIFTTKIPLSRSEEIKCSGVQVEVSIRSIIRWPIWLFNFRFHVLLMVYNIFWLNKASAAEHTNLASFEQKIFTSITAFSIMNFLAVYMFIHLFLSFVQIKITRGLLQFTLFAQDLCHSH